MSINVDEFLSQTTEDALDTQIQPVPEGEYSAIVTDLNMREFKYKKAERLGETGYSLDVSWEVQDEQLAADLGRTPTVRQSMLLDFSGDALDMSSGKNISLGRLRDALGQNEAGKPWAPQMLLGQVAIIRVKHRMDGDNIYTDVDRIAPA